LEELNVQKPEYKASIRDRIKAIMDLCDNKPSANVLGNIKKIAIELYNEPGMQLMVVAEDPK
jgi:hypothetical protein